MHKEVEIRAMTDRREAIEPIEGPGPVRRVLVRWDGKAWKIVADVYVPSMTLPAPDKLPDGDRSRGFWVETVDAKGQVRHREALADPFNGMELFDSNGDITRIMHPAHLDHSTIIEALVPDLEEAAELHIVSNPVTAEGDARPQRFVLKLPRGGGDKRPPAGRRRR